MARNDDSNPSLRETAVNTYAVSRSLAVASLLLAAPAPAAEYGPLEIVGFLKNEYSLCDNCSAGHRESLGVRSARRTLAPGTDGEPGRRLRRHRTQPVPRGPLHRRVPRVRQRLEDRGADGRPHAQPRRRHLRQLDDRPLRRCRPTPPTAPCRSASSRSRSWSRSDSFAYPLGLSSAWAESGAGYGLYPEAVRYTTPEFEMPVGKIRIEGSYGQADTRYPLNRSSLVKEPPDPWLYEIFVQFSNEKNLVELIYQEQRGRPSELVLQGCFLRRAGQYQRRGVVAGVRGPVRGRADPAGHVLHERTLALHLWVKRSEWSGQAQQCDFGPVSTVESACFWDQPGFNYSDEINAVYNATSWDLHARRLIHPRTLDLHGRRRVPEQGQYRQPRSSGAQDNNALFMNLGIYRTAARAVCLGGLFKMRVVRGYSVG